MKKQSNASMVADAPQVQELRSKAPPFFRAALLAVIAANHYTALK